MNYLKKEIFSNGQTLILREPAAKKWSMSMTVEQKKEATNSFLVGEVARHQERMPRREWSRLGKRLYRYALCVFGWGWGTLRKQLMQIEAQACVCSTRASECR